MRYGGVGAQFPTDDILAVASVCSVVRPSFRPRPRASVAGSAGRAVQTVARMIEFLGTSEPLSFFIQRGLVRRGLDGRGGNA